jgi:hypothetical protein
MIVNYTKKKFFLYFKLYQVNDDIRILTQVLMSFNEITEA